MTRISPPRSKRPSRLPVRRHGRGLPGRRLSAYGMVDALVGILILAVVALSVSAAFSALARLTRLQADRIDRLLQQSDAAAHAAWY